MTNLHEISPPINVPRFTTILLTPARAQELLDHQGHKRSISALYVGKLARDITAGRWHATHQTIATNKDGMLIDGHHRCSAIVKADIPAWVVLAEYPDAGPVNVFDQGAKRTAGHVLEMTGKVSTGTGSRYEALARALHVGLAQKHTTHLGPADIERIVDRFRGEFDWARGVQGRGLLAPYLAALAYVYPLHPEEVAEAATNLGRVANLVYRSPLWMLSQELQKTSRRLTYSGYPDAFVRALRTLEAHISKRPMRQLKGLIDGSESISGVIVLWSQRRQEAGLPTSTA